MVARALRPLFAGLLACGFGCSSVPAESPERGSEPFALVVLITVDQLRPDYLDRFSPNLSGGFARLVGQGAFFPRALQDHAMTWTAPGHATLWSGRFPAHTGIISNDLGVPDPAHPLIGAGGPGASPHRFVGSSLYDWIRAADSGARMLSVAQKDRGAILPVGTARVPTFWWSGDRFTTSSYYASELPEWVERFNHQVAEGPWSGREWRLALAETAYPEPDDRLGEDLGGGRGRTFPHRLGSLRDLQGFPWMDSLNLDLALTGARELGLGRGGSTDVLAVSLSSLDAIGHPFGPGSREVHDHFVWLDRWLGSFMTRLEADLHPGKVLWVLSSDHGVGEMPEVLSAETGGRMGGRIDLQGAVVHALARHGIGRDRVLIQGGLVLADTAALRADGHDVAALSPDLASRLAALDGVARTFTPATLASARPDDPSAGLWRRSISPNYGWLALAEPKAGWVLSPGAIAQHGTPLLENMLVPVFFSGERVLSGRFERSVRTVDVAPTIAALLGIRPTEPVDGELLRELLGRPGR